MYDLREEAVNDEVILEPERANLATGDAVLQVRMKYSIHAWITEAHSWASKACLELTYPIIALSSSMGRHMKRRTSRPGDADGGIEEAEEVPRR